MLESSELHHTRPTYLKPQRFQSIGIVSLIAGALGWWASLRLFQDYVSSLKDADFIPSCDLSSVISCGQNFSGSYGSLLGFSNTVIGLALFVIPLMVGVLILAKIQLPRWVYNGYSIGLFGAVLFISYLQFASFTDLKTLCLYCLLIWSVTIPLFWVSLKASFSLSLTSKDRAHRDVSRGVLGVVSNNWWLFALVHLSVVLVFSEVSIGALSGILKVVLSL